MKKQEILANSKKININNGPGVYFLIKNNEIIYIGSSKSPINRIYQHSDKHFDFYYIKECCLEDLKNLESNMIFDHSPKLNKSIPSKDNKKIRFIGTIKGDIENYVIETKVIANKVYARIKQKKEN